MSRPAVEYYDPPLAGPAQGSYSHCARVSAGDLVFIAGQLAIDKQGAVVGKGNFDAQFRQVFANMKIVLDSLGLTFNDIAKFTTYFVHSQDIEAFMRLRNELFPTLFSTRQFPPNTICVIDRLVKEEFLFEVEAIARAAD
jgi:enamine deaminase RidA (YjgF/YER057c/UK114 family)